MKYIISESRLYNMVKRYLDSKDFKIIDSRYGIFFADSESDSWARMRYIPKANILIINGELSLELEKLFGMEPEYVRNVVSDWVSEKLNVYVDQWETKTYHGTMADVNLSMR